MKRYCLGGDPIVVYIEKQHYGFFNFFLDCVLTLITGGLWLIWVFVREMRKR